MTEKTTPPRLSQRLQSARLKRGVSARRLAERIGASPTQIAAIEAGEESPTAAMLERMADALEMDLLDLVAAGP